MKVHYIHQLPVKIELFKSIQESLSKKVDLTTTLNTNNFKYIAGVDIAYWLDEGIEWGICSIIIIDSVTLKVIEKAFSSGKVTVPYIPGYLAFRELPLIIETVKKLTIAPDLYMFDGNGYLHPLRMGIATHASFFVHKPTIGIAKSYFKVNDAYFEIPKNEVGAFENITIGNEVLGRALRSHKDVRPIFISCGNFIDLDTATEFTLSLINKDSRLPIPVRIADLETKRIRKLLIAKTE
ncbi:endonuclease V [Sporosarcina oncorhynchi]|uniref:Endonuclease V n=1 Tax=Sporosarcina oncorhynchi TaxID=3056444 RepID=A0ABZ0L580_9BACL|nr:endonuclease V [Sporosarcina sp. T2O-4]WOV87258.1 endonuclease V [Sporosarcina sp. T2O-4]